MKTTLDFQFVTREVEQETFDCGVDSINQYIKDSYFPLIAQHAYTYKVLSSGKILAYIQFLFHDVKLSYFPEDISDVDPAVKEDSLTAIHIRFIAVKKEYHGNKIGTTIMKTAIKKIEDMASEWPVRLITIDARVELVEWYRKLGFKEMLENTIGQDGVTVAMFYDCIKDPEKLKDYLEDCIE